MYEFHQTTSPYARLNVNWKLGYRMSWKFFYFYFQTSINSIAIFIEQFLIVNVFATWSSSFQHPSLRLFVGAGVADDGSSAPIKVMHRWWKVPRSMIPSRCTNLMSYNIFLHLWTKAVTSAVFTRWLRHCKDSLGFYHEEFRWSEDVWTRQSLKMKWANF